MCLFDLLNFFASQNQTLLVLYCLNCERFWVDAIGYFHLALNENVRCKSKSNIFSLTFNAFDRPPSSTVDRIKIVFFDTLTLIESGRLMKTSGTPSFIVQRVELFKNNSKQIVQKFNQTYSRPLRKTDHDPSHHYPRYWQLSHASPLAWLPPPTTMLVLNCSQPHCSTLSRGAILTRSFSRLKLAVERRPGWRPQPRRRLN